MPPSRGHHRSVTSSGGRRAPSSPQRVAGPMAAQWPGAAPPVGAAATREHLWDRSRHRGPCAGRVRRLGRSSNGCRQPRHAGTTPLGGRVATSGSPVPPGPVTTPPHHRRRSDQCRVTRSPSPEAGGKQRAAVLGGASCTARRPSRDGSPPQRSGRPSPRTRHTRSGRREISSTPSPSPTSPNACSGDLATASPGLQRTADGLRDGRCVHGGPGPGVLRGYRLCRSEG